MKRLWADIIHAVENPKPQISKTPKVKNNKDYSTKINKKFYVLGESNPNIYFTQREVDCMKLLMRGNTINGTALKLGLSHRTIEFYVKNMKMKLRCTSKAELIEKVTQTELLKLLFEK